MGGGGCFVQRKLGFLKNAELEKIAFANFPEAKETG